MPPAVTDDVVVLLVGFIGVMGVGICVFVLLYILDKGFRDAVNKELRG